MEDMTQDGEDEDDMPLATLRKTCEDDDIPLSTLQEKWQKGTSTTSTEADYVDECDIEDAPLDTECMALLKSMIGEFTTFTNSEDESMSIDSDSSIENESEERQSRQEQVVQENKAKNQGKNQEDQEGENQDQQDNQERQQQITPDTQEKIQEDQLRVIVDKESDMNENAEQQGSTGSSRKRKVCVNTWQRKTRKANKNKGLAYTSSKGKHITGRKMKDTCPKKCPLKCSDHFTPEERKTIFETFWGSGEYETQRDYIAQNVLSVAPKRVTVGRQRDRKPRMYFLTLGNKRVRVCKLFFMNTLDIKEKTVNYTLLKKHNRAIPTTDGRGRKTSVNKVSTEALKRIRTHIEKFPCVESHYCRQSSKRKYLSGDLSVKKMYEMYKSECNTKAESLATYRNVFNNCYNLGFHKPKKDQCKQCTVYKTLTPEQKQTERNAYEQHLFNKQRCREEKQIDKERAAVDPSFVSVTFDLQQVLPTPSSEISTLYYKRKLSSYNLTVYNQATHDGTCYLWSEVHGARGSSEIGTCLIKYLQSLPQTIHHVSLFSDCCGGQNRNQFIAAALSYVVRTNAHISIIDQKFLETGHTQMEVDSIHSTIERAKKHIPVFHPDNWAAVIRMSRRNHPYKVVQFTFRDIIDLHYLSKVLFTNVKKNVHGEQVHWLKIKHLRFEKASPSIVKYKYSLDDDFSSIKVAVAGRRRSGESLQKEAKSLYSTPLSICSKKLKDLLSLCESKIIPECYHTYYYQLKGVEKEE